MSRRGGIVRRVCGVTVLMMTLAVAGPPPTRANPYLGKPGEFGEEITSIYVASVKYQENKVPLIVLAGKDYGMGSSRDWAAKGVSLLGVKAVIAESYERIHRSNLVGMGVLPCQLTGMTAESLRLDGTETFDLTGLEAGIRPRQELQLDIRRADGTHDRVPVLLRIDTPIEVDYYRHGGILPYVLRQILARV